MSKGTVLITGAAGAMGSACIERLSRDGFDIAAFDINGEGLVVAIQKAESTAQKWVVDQTDESAVRSATEEVEREMGPIEAFVNTTGWCVATRFYEEDSMYWKKVVAINYLGALYVTHAILPGMMERNRGKIVYITSDAAKVGTGGEAVYAGAKAAECAFAKSLAREMARYNINVNCTAPGPTDTPLMREVQEQNPMIIERTLKQVPFRRLGLPEEQASVVSFLVSEDARWITGQIISVSGGLTMC